MKKRKLVFVIAIGIIATVTVTILGIMIFSNAETKETSFTDLILETTLKRPGWMKEITNKKENKKMSELEIHHIKTLTETGSSVSSPYSSLFFTFFFGTEPELAFSMGSGARYLLDQLCKRNGFQIENIQMIDDDTLFIPFRLQYEDYSPVFAFFFFKKGFLRETEQWVFTGDVYCFNPDEIHISSDYNNISEGSLVEELIIIDSSIRYDYLRRINNRIISENGSVIDAFLIVKYLKDGIQIFKISMDQPIVLEKTFFSYSDSEMISFYDIPTSTSSFLDCLLTE